MRTQTEKHHGCRFISFRQFRHASLIVVTLCMFQSIFREFCLSPVTRFATQIDNLETQPTNPQPNVPPRLALLDVQQPPNEDQCEMPEDRQAMDENWWAFVEQKDSVRAAGGITTEVGGYVKGWKPTLDCPNAFTILTWVNASQGIIGCPPNVPMWTFYERGETRALDKGTAKKVHCSQDGRYTLQPGWGVTYGNSIRLRPSHNPEAVQRATKVLERRAQQERQGKGEKQSENSTPPHILMYMLDAVSRPAMYRSLKATRQTIQSVEDRSEELHTNVFEFHRHHSVGGSSVRNILPMLSGLLLTDIQEKIAGENGHAAIIFEELRRLGYITINTHNDCVLNNATFGEKRGKNSPESYFPHNMEDIGWFSSLFCRPKADEPRLVIPAGKCARFPGDTWCSTSPERIMGRLSCAGGRSRTSLVLEHYLQAREDHKGVPTFTFLHDFDVHAPNLINVNRYDADKATIFPMLEHVLNDTVVIFLSDHGNQYAISGTRQGALEYKMPFLFMFVPDQVLDRNPSWKEALTTNQKVLSSPLDVHETMVHLGGGRHAGDLEWWEEHGHDKRLRGSSLLDRLPFNRSCEEAGIPEAECVCGRIPMTEERKDSKIWTSVLKKDMPRLMEYMNFELNRTSALPNTCRELVLESLLSVAWEDFRHAFRHYQVRFALVSPRTEPMEFQASFVAGLTRRNGNAFTINTVIQTSRFAKWVSHCEAEATAKDTNLHFCDCANSPIGGWENVVDIEAAGL